MGIIFSADCSNVYLIRKDHPEWQAGLLNGVGGKLEPGETYADCMAREGKEEAGYAGDWNHLGSMRGDGEDAFQCEVFYSVMEKKTKEPKTTEKEPIEMHPVADLPALTAQMVPHLPMLILAALTHHTARAKFSLGISYTASIRQ
jgi:8-oxo-dGTP pyrophosphatase MutT (NUDIX family)